MKAKTLWQTLRTGWQDDLWFLLLVAEIFLFFGLLRD